MPRDVKIFGMPRSGSNFVKAVLQRSIIGLKVNQNIGKWKHALVFHDDIKRVALPTVTCIKNPYAHLYSLFVYPKNFPGNDVLHDVHSGFAEFLRSAVTFYQCRNTPGARVEIRFANPIQWWNTFTWHYVHFANPMGNVLVSYDHFLREPSPYVQRVVQLTERVQKDTIEDDVKRTVLPSHEDLEFGGPFNRALYLNGEFRGRYDQEMLKVVNSNLDVELMRKCDYEFIE